MSKANVAANIEQGLPKEAWRGLERLKGDLGALGRGKDLEFLQVQQMTAGIKWAMGDVTGAISMAKLVAGAVDKPEDESSPRTTPEEKRFLSEVRAR